MLLSSHEILRIYYILYMQIAGSFAFGRTYSRGRVDLWTESTHAHPCHTHPHTHLPTSRLARSSRTMSHLEGNPSAASNSVVASSAANSSSVKADGSAASSAPGSNPVDEGEPEAVLQPPTTAETTISESNKSFSVTIQPPMVGRRKLTSWVWRYLVCE